MRNIAAWDSWPRDKQINRDGFVKSPSAALRFTLVAAAYLVSRPRSSGFARLASEAFYFAIVLITFNTKADLCSSTVAPHGA
jgi:hypothetical protein